MGAMIHGFAGVTYSTLDAENRSIAPIERARRRAADVARADRILHGPHGPERQKILDEALARLQWSAEKARRGELY